MTCNDDCENLPCPSTSGIISSTCGCSQACNCTPATPTPYYNQAAGCEESHKQVIIQNQYVTGVTTSAAATMPACGETTVLTFPGLQLIPIGSYLWNPTFGYLKVISFDYASSSVIVENECQDGNAAPGTAIPSCSVFTVVDTPAGIDNPCTNAAVTEGALVVCKDGVMQPLDATAAGQVPVSTDAGTNEVEFQTLDLPVLECTELASDVTLIPANSGPYALTVVDTTGFVAGDIIQFAGLVHRLEVNTVPDGIHMTATIITSAPAGFEVIPAGTPVCLSSCCEQITQLFNTPCDWDLSTRMYLGSNVAISAPQGTETLHLNDSFTSNPVDILFVNSLCSDSLININIEYRFDYECRDTLPPDDVVFGRLLTYPNYGYVVGAIGTTVPPVPSPLQTLYTQILSTTVAVYDIHSFYFTTTQQFILSAGFEARIALSLTGTIDTAVVGFEVDLTDISVLAKYFRVAI